MKTTINAFSVNSQMKNININVETPHSCPRCGIAYADAPRVTYYSCLDGFYEYNIYAYSLYFCPNCGKCFFIEYRVSNDLYSPETYTAYTDAVYPHPDIEKGFSEDIAKLSPNFIKIYHQAEKAENMGLSEICGLGYRKALEFLIKDYGILFHPDDEEKIKNMALSPCINTYIDNPRIKTLATASDWIGNDETHYVRKHEDYNLEHLKIFISATVSFINSELSYLKAEQLLNTPK